MLATGGLYGSSYWDQRYRHVGDNDDNSDYYDDYDSDYYNYNYNYDDDDERTVDRPSFVQTTSRNISVHRGATGTLCCQVQHLGQKTV